MHDIVHTLLTTLYHIRDIEYLGVTIISGYKNVAIFKTHNLAGIDYSDLIISSSDIWISYSFQ